MKKIFILVLCLSAFIGTAHAAVGDKSETVYNTDILTKIHGLDIESFAIDGEMLIIAEDLRDYGYTVTYDDVVRALFVNHTGHIKDDFNPWIKRGQVGGVWGCTYETDIDVYFNGSYINSFALDGKMAIKVEEIGERTGFTYAYNDDERLLTLDSVDVPSKEQRIKETLTLGEELSFLSLSHNATHTGNGFDVVIYTIGGMPRGAQTFYEYFDDHGKCVSLDGIFNRYGFHDGWGETEISDVKLSGNYLEFYGQSCYTRKELNFPLGNYMLDLCTHTIMPSPVGQAAKAGACRVQINGIDVPAYSIMGKPYINSEVLEKFGFVKEGLSFTRSEETAIMSPIIENNTELSEIEYSEEKVIINNKEYQTYLVNDKYLISADDLAMPDRNIIKNGFSGEWDAVNGVLIIEII